MTRAALAVLVCAACGDSAPGGGNCGAAGAPTAIVNGVSPTAMALDGSDLYLTVAKSATSDFLVMRAATTGGTPQMIAAETGQTTPGGLCTDASGVYWARGGDLVAWRKPNGPGAPIATVAANVQGCASDGTNVYFIASTLGMPGGNGGFVGRVPAAGGAVEMLANVMYPNVMTLDGGTVFVGTIGNGSGGASVQRITAGAVAEISGANLVGGIATDATDVYWSDAESGASGTIKHAPKGGGPVTTVAQSNVGFPVGVATGGPYLYWTNPNEHAVYSQIGSDQPIVIANAPGLPRPILTAGCTIYVGVSGEASADQGSILKIQR